MGRYTIFLDWQNQHCQNDYSAEDNLQTQCSSCQIASGTFHRTGLFTEFVKKEMLRKKTDGGKSRHPVFRLYHKATVIRMVWYWHKQTYRP